MIGSSYDIVLIGGGIVGCALARALASQHRKVLVLEKEPLVGFQTCRAQSGVIHPGLTATPGSLQARWCVQGNVALRRYVQDRNVPFEQVGLLVMARRDNEVSRLEELKSRGERNGVPGLELLPIHVIHEHEPRLQGIMGLFAPTGGIVDPRVLVQTLADDARRRGARVSCWQEVVDIEERSDGVVVKTLDSRFHADLVINCAGYSADRLAHRMGVGRRFPVVPVRRGYYAIADSQSHAVQSILSSAGQYGQPLSAFHVIRTLEDGVLVGPEERPVFGAKTLRRYGVEPAQGGMDACRNFWKSMRANHLLRTLTRQRDHPPTLTRRLWEQVDALIREIPREALVPTSRVSVRPQRLDQHGRLVDDLVLESTERSLHVLNVPSPGLTCALAFADWLADRLHGRQWGWCPSGSPRAEPRMAGVR